MDDKKHISKILDSCWNIIFLGTGILAAVYFYSMAGGFPASSLFFWCNTIFCPLIVLFIIAAFYSKIKEKEHAHLLCKRSFFSFLLSFIITAKVIFPQTMRMSFLVVMLVMVIGLSYSLLTESSKKKPLLTIPYCVLALVFGIFLPLSQRGADAVTAPLNPVFENFPVQINKTATALNLGHKLQFYPNSATLNIQSADSKITIHPLLNFDSVSPDRCWTVLARRRDMFPTPLKISGYLNSEKSFTGFYSQGSDETAILSASEISSHHYLIEARTKVRQEIWFFTDCCKN
jgi:hypothetical protein